MDAQLPHLRRRRRDRGHPAQRAAGYVFAKYAFRAKGPIFGMVLASILLPSSLLSVIPLVIAFVSLQKYWRVDLTSGAVKF